MKPHEPFDPNKELYELDLDDEIDSDEPDISSETRNEGEGSRSAARRYQDKLQTFIDEGRVTSAARDAARAVDDPSEGPELRAAEEAGKAPAHMSRVAKLKGVARAFIGGAKAAYEEAKRK
ncbi:MAG TPA: hypothetical protein VM261_01930 [Kofleriaceae bacterium]|nr:hypothetical protein [Kofleriaceae bacterium]